MRAFVASLVVSLAFVLAGCAPATPQPSAPPVAPTTGATTSQQAPGVSDSEIVLGTWQPMSGPAAGYAPIGKAMDAYFKMVNEQGGINGRKVRMIVEDDGYNPARTVPLVKKMVEEDHVFAFLGGLGTGTGSAVLDYIVQNHVPHIAPSTGSSKWSDPVQPGYYAYQISYKTEAKILVKYGVEQLNKRKFAIFYQNDDFGKEGLEEAKLQLKNRNADLVAEVAYNPTDTDYSAYAVKLQQSGADAVLAWAVPAPFGSLLKETGKIGFKPTWLNSATINDPSLLKLAGDELQGAYFVAWLPNPDDPANADNPAIKDWRENLPKYAPDVPLSNFSLTGWGESRLMHEILRRAGKDLTRASLEAAAQSLKDWTDLATVTYTATDRRGVTVGYIAQAKGTTIVRVSDPIKAD